MIYKLIILYLLSFVYAKIEVDISATNKKRPAVRVSGSHVDPISDTERNTYALTEERLKKSISSILGKAPDGVYLGNPAPYGGLYKILNWEPVRRVFMPKNVSILSLESNPVLVHSGKHSNRDSEPKIKREKICISNLMSTVSSKWDHDGDLSVGNMFYHLDLKKPNDSVHIEFAAQFGENALKSIPVDVASDIDYILKPNQTAKTIVYVTKETTKMTVDYLAILVGAVVADYEDEYRGHRFWSLDINTVLDAAGLSQMVRAWEAIQVVHVTEAKVLIKDADTNELIHSATLQMH